MRVDGAGVTEVLRPGSAVNLAGLYQIEEPWIYFENSRNDGPDYDNTVLMRYRLDNTAPAEELWRCAPVGHLVLDATSIFVQPAAAGSPWLRFDKPGASPSPAGGQLLGAIDGTLVVDGQHLYEVGSLGLRVADKTGSSCSCSCKDAPPGTSGSGGTGGSQGAGGGQGGTSGGYGGAGGFSGDGPSECSAPPRAGASSDPGLVDESLVSACPTFGPPMGHPLGDGSIHGLPKVEQDEDWLYFGDTAVLYRVPKSGADPQRLHASETVETFAMDGAYIYASVTDGSAQGAPTYRRIVRFDPDGSNVTVLADAAVGEHLVVESMVVTEDAVYYVLADAYGGCTSDLYRVPVHGGSDASVDGGASLDGDAAAAADEG
jgi:hypothetical protein